jgi:hypothetical protein
VKEENRILQKSSSLDQSACEMLSVDAKSFRTALYHSYPVLSRKLESLGSSIPPKTHSEMYCFKKRREVIETCRVVVAREGVEPPTPAFSVWR